MYVTITGGAGFIGSNLAHHLCEKHKLLIYDKLTYAGNVDNLKAIRDKITFYQGDVCEFPTMYHLFKDDDWILHLSAESHVDRSIKSPHRFVKTNVEGTQQILEVARQLDIKVLHVSTDEVYGPITYGYLGEDAPMKPTSPYASTKASGDLLAQSYYKTYGLEVIIARPSNNFGRFQYPEKIIPLFVTNLLQGKKVPVYGTGKQVRSWLHVDDTCRALELLMEKGQFGEIYNIGSKHEERNINLTEKILDYMGENTDSIEHVEDRKAHDFRYAITSTKIQNLGWKQQNYFEKDLEETIDWYINNKEWWKKICTE